MATKSLGNVGEMYRHRDRRARELRGQGKKIMGYLCCYPPIELVTAADLVPYRITGTLQPLTEVDAYLEVIMCNYIRSCFEMGIKGEYDFLDGMIWPHTCDNIVKAHDVWKYYIKTDFFHFLDIPHMAYDSSFEFFKFHLGLFKESLEDYAGTRITEEKLNEAIKLHNQNRSLLRELSSLRKGEPPLLTGSEMVQVLIATMTIPVAEANDLVAGVIQEVTSRQERPQQKAARLLVYGCEIDDIALINLAEDCGANVIIDDTCIGTRYYWDDVAVSDDPLASLSHRYLDKVRCPRTYKAQTDWDSDRLARYGHLRDFARDFRANGAIIYLIRYCDCHEWDIPDVRNYLQEAGVPVLVLEDDYSLTSIGAFRTRIEAFVEMIAQGG